MKISHGTRIKEMSDMNGYGYATAQMLASLQRLGHEVNQNDSSADVEIWFDQPHHWQFSKGVYKIGYHPWESTQLLPGWAEKMNQCDEIWTPSPLIADWYTRHAGITAPVHVYEHGVSPDWTPKQREVRDTFKFLHLGAEAARKGGKEAMQAMRLAFGNNEPVELNLKIISDGWNVGWFSRVKVINEMYSKAQLIQLFHDSHAYVYPSWGEGFGLTPLQALATGMPTITVGAWAPYRDFLDPKLTIGSQMFRSPFPVLHPGSMLKPSLDDTIDAMRYVYHNYEQVQAEHHARVNDLLAFYNWDRLTKATFEALEVRLKNL